jgi:glutamine---fructose-6-phosphate transaminase (isomerizing)
LLSTIFVISRSGESAEVVKLLNYLHPMQQLIVFTEEPTSPLARPASKTFLINAKERSFVNTKSFILSIAYAGAVAAGILNQSFIPLETELRKASNQIPLLIRQNEKEAELIAGKFATAKSLLVVARGSIIGIGQQLCLDLQEGLHIPAIPVSGSLLRHGTIELTTQKDVASLFIVNNDYAGQLLMTAAKEIAAYNKMVAIIGPKLVNSTTTSALPIVEIGELATPIIYTVAAQLIYYKLALQRGITQIKPTLVGKVTRTE